MDSGYSYSFPATRGTQAGKPFYIAMCPLRIVPRIFTFDEEDVPPELRAQRKLNYQRIPAITRYLLDKPDEYIFSALTASVDSAVGFESMAASGPSANLGMLSIPMDATILINDGQHRRAAIEEAVKENPDLGHDNIAVLFFIDEGLKRSQQMFVDLNMYQVRPDPSLITLYNHADQESAVASDIATYCPPFAGLTDLERSSLSKRSNKLFTLSSVKHANRTLLNKGRNDRFTDDEVDLAKRFWAVVADYLPFWKLVKSGEIAASTVREEHIFSHGVVLQAIGVVGRYVIGNYPNDWWDKLAPLGSIDWSKSNTDRWNGRAIQYGKVTKSKASMLLTVNGIKEHLGLELTPEEDRIEKEYRDERR